MKKLLFLALTASSLSLAACNADNTNSAEGSASGAAMTSTRIGDANGNEGKVDTVRTDAGTPTNDALPDTMAGQ